MSNVKLFVEGKADIKFLKDYVLEIFNVQLDSKKNFYNLEGYTNLNYKALPEFSIDSSQINLVILDADFVPNDGGFESRKREIELIKMHQKLDFQLFLFPNNSDNGDLELLLCNAIADTNSSIFECWDTFETCLKNQSENYTIPAMKSKVHTYLEVLHGNSASEKKKCKEENRDYTDKTKWNLNNDCLNALKDFLTPFFTSQV